MLTYTGALTIYQKLSKDSSSTNTTVFNTVYNEHNRIILSAFPWPFLERTKDLTTIANQQFYDLPYNTKKVINVTVTVGTTKYSPIPINSRQEWDLLNLNTSETSDFPQYYFIFNGQIGIYPTPSSDSNTITVNHTIRVKDITLADYTTGTITTATNGDETIVGGSTSWTDKMADSWIRITDSNTANTGDGQWYEVDSITDATNLELVSPYQGVSISAGTASYTIGQVSQIPEDYQMAPLFFTLSDYWLKEDKNKSESYSNKGNILVEQMKDQFGMKDEDPTLDYDQVKLRNPNLYLNL